MAQSKVSKLSKFLDGTNHISGAMAGLEAYNAAKAAIYGLRRIGNDRQVAAIKKALRPLNVMVSPGSAPNTVRIFKPVTREEFILA